jgi:hypothetical protein
MRLTREPFWMDWPLANGGGVGPRTHSSSSSLAAQSRLRQQVHTQRVFGLQKNDRVDETCVLNC